jgi:hypothetical protein
MKFQSLSLFLLLLSLTGCEKIHYYPDKTNYFVETKFLAHRGVENSTIQENTLEAVNPHCRGKFKK